MEPPIAAGHVGWSHFLTNLERMLYEYDQATALTRGKSVPVYKGIVAEQVLRDWLRSFLPSKYGVTSGYIVPPEEEDNRRITHFDIIIFDKLSSPILWSEIGDVLAIPMEFVVGVMEVKSSLTTKSFKDALSKLKELAPLAQGVDRKNSRTKRYLPANFFAMCIFFEQRSVPRILSHWVDFALRTPRTCPTIFIMRSAAMKKCESAFIRLVTSPPDAPGAHQGSDGNFYYPLGSYGVQNFQMFAFYLLSRLEGREHPTAPSSYALPPAIRLD